MKNYPLSIQIWIIFAVITLAIGLIISTILPITLRSFFTKEIYSTIESAQNDLLGRSTIEGFTNDSTFDDRPNSEDIRLVKHFLVYGDNQIVMDSPVNFEFLNQVKDNIASQGDTRVRYSKKFSSERLFYVITKDRGFRRDAYLVSYMGDSYRRDLVGDLFGKLITTMVFIILLSWIPALLLSKYLSRPLIDLEHRVNKLTNQDWTEAINLNRKDEIGKLADSVEKLRTQLIRQDKVERSFLQNISHELKTPVMVIRSFAEAIKDGIFPKGNLDNSIEVIDEESRRLEKKIRNLLYFSKLDYMESHELVEEEFSLDNLIMSIVDKMSWGHQDIDWDIELGKLDIIGDGEQWKVAIENLIDNQIRYAQKQISIKLFPDETESRLEISNDGPPIEEDLVESIFTEYKKGYKGEFGLGLAIVQRAMNYHNAVISLKNEDPGVKFIIKIKS